MGSLDDVAAVLWWQGAWERAKEVRRVEMSIEQAAQLSRLLYHGANAMV